MVREEERRARKTMEQQAELLAQLEEQIVEGGAGFGGAHIAGAAAMPGSDSWPGGMARDRPAHDSNSTPSKQDGAVLKARIPASRRPTPADKGRGWEARSILARLPASPGQ